ncbi:MAG: hemolysin III family protein [Lachnospiraceae bacterium]|nr:hemolysin III family protein [Lachnospiraceae bacterium]
MQITIREPGSAITHFIGMIMVMLAAIPLLTKAANAAHTLAPISLSIFILTMLLLYGASTTYHAVSLSDKSIKFFKRLDHMMIFALIAGSYTPVCMTILEGKIGVNLLIAIWSLAGIGMLFKLLWVTCPKWFSSLIYIAMGWVCVVVIGPLAASLDAAALFWLAAGGLIYTAGGIIYALKLKLFNSRHRSFGSHEIFHIFVMGGSFCHFIFMFFYIA